MTLVQHHDLKSRTQEFALRIIRMSQKLPRNREPDVIARQVLRSATSMAANYRAAGRGRSKPEFIAKLSMVIEEADETIFWLEMLSKAGIVRATRLEALINEANQLMAIFGASWRTAKQNGNPKKGV